jgi:uncharacterized protein (TIGR03086 family)
MTADPRPQLWATLDQAGEVLRDVRPAQFPLPTPCDDFDVQRLIGHLLGVLGRIEHVGAGGLPFEVPSIVEGVTDPVPAWEEARKRLEAVWSDDAVLDRPMQVPWGAVTGRGAALGYTQELLAHTWDLAVATGQRARLDDDLAAPTLDFAHERVPAEPRGGPIPFAPPVELASSGGTYERLAAWLGRDPSNWVQASVLSDGVPDVVDD